MAFAGSKALITGGAGFIGSHLADVLIKQGATVTILDDFSNGLEENIAEALSTGKARLVRGSVEDTGLVKSLVKNADYIFHEAALNLLRSLENPANDLRVNAGGTLNILMAMQELNPKCALVFASTGSVYGEPQYNPQDEEHPLRPVSPYGVSKLAAEHYVNLWTRLYKTRAVMLRYYNVYGPRQNYGSKGGVIGIFIDRVMRGESPIIEGTGANERCFTFVDDVVKANLLAANSTKAQGQAINIGNTEITTIKALAEMVIKTGHKDLKLVYAPARLGDIATFRPDISLAEKLLGYRPAVMIREGLQKTLDWFIRTGKV
jgi:nucleoside-diphosphate-sugar epimerase